LAQFGSKNKYYFEILEGILLFLEDCLILRGGSMFITETKIRKLIKDEVVRYLQEYGYCISVDNILGTGHEDHPNYKSWLEFWCENTNTKIIPPCSNIECSNKAEYGGHVLKLNGNDKTWHIIPICNSCNKLKRPYFVAGNVKFIPIPQD
jgi:hypothetical protein